MSKVKNENGQITTKDERDFMDYRTVLDFSFSIQWLLLGYLLFAGNFFKPIKKITNTMNEFVRIHNPLPELK